MFNAFYDVYRKTKYIVFHFVFYINTVGLVVSL